MWFDKLKVIFYFVVCPLVVSSLLLYALVLFTFLFIVGVCCFPSCLDRCFMMLPLHLKLASENLWHIFDIDNSLPYRTFLFVDWFLFIFFIIIVSNLIVRLLSYGFKETYITDFWTFGKLPYPFLCRLGSKKCIPNEYDATWQPT